MLPPPPMPTLEYKHNVLSNAPDTYAGQMGESKRKNKQYSDGTTIPGNISSQAKFTHEKDITRARGGA